MNAINYLTERLLSQYAKSLNARIQNLDLDQMKVFLISFGVFVAFYSIYWLIEEFLVRLNKTIHEYLRRYHHLLQFAITFTLIYQAGLCQDRVTGEYIFYTAAYLLGFFSGAIFQIALLIFLPSFDYVIQMLKIIVFFAMILAIILLYASSIFVIVSSPKKIF